MTHYIKRILRESLLEKNQEIISTLYDILDMNPDSPNSQKYINRLQQDFGLTYQPPSVRFERENSLIDSVVGQERQVVTSKGLSLVLKCMRTERVEKSLSLYAYHEGTLIGRLGMGLDLDTGLLRIGGAEVQEAYRRLGVYSAIIDWVEELAQEWGLELAQSGRSQDAQAFWGHRTP